MAPHLPSPLGDVEEEAIKWPLPKTARGTGRDGTLTLTRKDEMVYWLL